MGNSKLHILEKGERPACPCCGAKEAVIGTVCNACKTRVVDKLEDGKYAVLDPKLMDRSKKYKVEGFVDGRKKAGFTEFYPGEIVEFAKSGNTMQMTDYSSEVYVDGERNIERFVMPERTVYITSMTSGMAMNSTRFYGPYGELLRGPVFCPENIIKDGEDPAPVNIMGTPMMGAMTNMGMMGFTNNIASMPVNDCPESEKIVCKECKAKTKPGKFCQNCGCIQK